MSILQRLKEDTRDLHGQTQGAVRLMEPGFTPVEYRRYLERLHGLHVPMEPLLEAHLGREPGLELPRRFRRSALEQDLRALGHDDASLGALPRANVLPSVESASEAYGCLYVLEGSTLGGQLLLRHLAKHFDGERVGDFVYLRAHGEETGRMWKSFGAALTEAVAAGRAMPDAVVRGARETFVAFNAWLRAGL